MAALRERKHLGNCPARGGQVTVEGPGALGEPAAFSSRPAGLGERSLSSPVLSFPTPPCPPVIDGLDLLKKEHPGARDGIRYLEAEFKKGNR